MQYKIIGDVMPVVEVVLDAGEAFFTQSGGMCYMSEGIEMSTNTRGGLMKGLGRMLAGESLTMTTYTARKNGAYIGFSATAPGEIIPMDLRGGRRLICQKSTFLCAEDDVEVSIAFSKKLSTGIFGGEGFILQELKGNGIVFLEADGNLVEKDLAPGETIKVDTGNVVCFEDTVRYDIEMIKGGMNIFLGGEGLFLTTLTGPGKVIIQSQNFAEFASRVGRYVVKKD